jgi:hypothetical protein
MATSVRLGLVEAMAVEAVINDTVDLLQQGKLGYLPVPTAPAAVSTTCVVHCCCQRVPT